MGEGREGEGEGRERGKGGRGACPSAGGCWLGSEQKLESQPQPGKAEPLHLGSVPWI